MPPPDEFTTPSPSLAPGKEVLKRYLLTRLLGRGGMGVVWLARDLELERDVALKFLPDSVALDKVAVHDLKREVRRAIDLSHPNIVKIYDFVTDGSLAGISMELVSGRTFSERRLDLPNKIFSLQALGPIVAQLCGALHYAHTDARVVHRDLKPANIMVTSENRVKILDFGIAASISESASRVSNKGTSGTLAYMSPQQLLGREPKPSDDIYALGATIYELLTSKPPFFRGDITHQSLHEVPPPMAARRADLGLSDADGIPDDWERVVAACLAKEPAERPSSVAEVARRLGLGGGATANFDSDLTVRVPRSLPAFIPSAVPLPPAPPPPPILSAMPLPSPSAIVPARKRMPAWLKWALGSVAIAGGIGGLFFGFDLPGRLASRQTAARLPEKSATAEISPSVPGVGPAPAGKLPPPVSDEPAQKALMGDLRRRLDRLAPNEQLALLDKEIPALEPRLTPDQREELATWRQNSVNANRAEGEAKLASAQEANQAGRFPEALALLNGLAGQASFSPQIGEARTRLQLAAVRGLIDRATTRLADQDYPGALAALLEAEKTGLLPDEVAAVKTKILRASEPSALRRLNHVVSRQSSPEEVQAAIDEYARTTGRTPSTPAQALQSEHNLDRFLGMLEHLHLRSTDGTPRKQADDLALVASRRNQFDQPDRVAEFLARGYQEWAGQQLQEKNRGFALYLESLAKAEGGPGDAKLERSALSSQNNDLGLDLAIARPEIEPRSSTVVGSSVREAIQRALTDKIGSYFRIRAVDTPEPGVPIVIRLRVQGPSSEQQRQSRNAVAEYLGPGIPERNPLWSRKREELDIAIAEGKRAGIFAIFVPKVMVNGKPLYSTPADIAQQKIVRVQNELNGIPQTLAKNRTFQEPYQITSIKTEFRADVTAQLECRGALLDQSRSWQAATSHLSEEVIGNPNHNIPVKTAEHPDLALIARHLADEIANQAREATRAWLPALCDASFGVIRQKLQEGKASPEQIADHLWMLAQYWEKAGITVSERSNLEQDVRRQLGLP